MVHLKLSELPSMHVEAIRQEGDVLRITGRFDRLDGVREGGCFRLGRGQYAWANLTIADRSACIVTVTNERDPEVARLRVGQRYPWLHDYWQPPLVEAIADEAHVWRKFTFEPSDARYFKQGEAVGWQQLGRRLPSGATDLGVRPGGWDHEHCGLCDRHIDPDEPIGYTDDDGQFLCFACYMKYGAHHDVSFEVGA
jgi:hypothetical protein